MDAKLNVQHDYVSFYFFLGNLPNGKKDRINMTAKRYGSGMSYNPSSALTAAQANELFNEFDRITYKDLQKPNPKYKNLGEAMAAIHAAAVKAKGVVEFYAALKSL